MTNFIETNGDLLDADVDALVNTVNTVGVMGKGIALQFKNAFPDNFKNYENACKRNKIVLGRMFVFELNRLFKPHWIVNFPTKDHWRSRSLIKYLAAGLDDLRIVIADLGISSIAIPPLGCGNGGLNWNEVRPLIEDKLQGLAIDVHLYAPVGAPSAADMTVSTPRPPLTAGKAAMLAMLDRYSRVALGASLIEVQKLMYFLQEAGEPLHLQYQPMRYGPYADNLRHVLKAVEGHYLQGFGDGSARVPDAEPIRVLPGCADEAIQQIKDKPTEQRVERVLRLARGFESAYGLELLATTHYVATRDDLDDNFVEVTSHVGRVVQQVQGWNERKRHMFTKEHIETAWNHLQIEGWLTPSPAPIA